MTNTSQPTVYPLTYERHGNLRLTRREGFAFMKDKAYARLYASEYHWAAHTFPLAFIKEGTKFGLIAMFSPIPGRNLFVNEANQWIGAYTPAIIRQYPFMALHTRLEGEDYVFCIDEGAGKLSEVKGHKLYNKDRTLSEHIQKIQEVFYRIQTDSYAVERGIRHLDEAGLIVPWYLGRDKPADEEESAIYHIDSEKLRGLSDADFAALRPYHGLEVAYAQMHSEPKITQLWQLAYMHAMMSKDMPDPEKEDKEVLKEDEVEFNFF